MTQKTAILIFANSPEVDAKRKNLHQGKQLFEKLNKNLIQKVERSGLPYFLITDTSQKGKNFADRFYNALNYVFGVGYENVITIGNDTPQLKTQHLLKADEALAQNISSIGPSVDGGFYLLGIHKDTFRALDFKNFAWQSPKLYHQIISALEDNQQAIQNLEVFADLDNLDNLKQVQNFIHKISIEIQQLISALLTSLKFNFINPHLMPIGVTPHIPFNKGSPCI